MTRRILALFAGVMFLSGATAFAHHSFSATYTGEKVEIEGIVKEFVWRNPHSFLRMDVADQGRDAEDVGVGVGLHPKGEFAMLPLNPEARRIPDRQGWGPTPCRADQAR